MTIERFLDYIQFTANIAEEECRSSAYEPCYPIQFYQRGYRDENSTRIYYGNTKNPSLALVVMSGKALQAYRDDSYKDQDILAWCIERNAKFSRLDLAVTEWAVDGKKIVQVKDIQEWFRSGLVTSPLAKWGGKMIEGVKVGLENTQETFYIGDPKKRAKRGIFRAYDKGVEMDLEPYLGTRLELELKRDKAHSNALRIAKTGDISGNFRASFDINHSEFDRIMQAEAVTIVRGKGKPKQELEDEMKKKWDWLIEQVAPALKSAIQKDKELGYGDKRLSQFIIEAGLAQEMTDAVMSYVKTRIQSLRNDQDS